MNTRLYDPIYLSKKLKGKSSRFASAIFFELADNFMAYLQVQIHDEMFPERRAASFLYVQEDHDIVSVEVEPEVIV